jgi:hypothetical protein
MIDVVVARHNEDIWWTKALGTHCRLFVYNKGNDGLLRLPNIGREAHTYLFHIVKMYDSLPVWTFFAQADANKHLTSLPFQDVINGFPRTIPKCALHIEGGPYFFVSSAVRYNQGFKDGEDWESGVSELWRELFTSEPPHDILFAPGAIFAISKEKLLTRSVAFYQRAMELAATRPRGPWEFERLWAQLWTSSLATRL